MLGENFLESRYKSSTVNPMLKFGRTSSSWSFELARIRYNLMRIMNKNVISLCVNFKIDNGNT